MLSHRYVSGLALILGLCTVTADSKQQDASFSEAFKDNKLTGWDVQLSQGNRIEAIAGELRISARQNTFANITRSLTSDQVRVSGQIKGEDGISWCTSLFLYWDAGNWIQIGVIGDSNRFYTCEMVNGESVETRGTPCDPKKWQGVALELGRDVVRSYTSEDGKVWSSFRSVPRPRSWKAKPSRFIVGKGYGSSKSPYDKSNLQNSYSDPGPMLESAVRDIRIEPTSKDRLHSTSNERRRWKGQIRDEAGDAILAMQGDPTFDRIKKIYPAMKNAHEAVGVKDHPHEFLIDPDGAVVFGGDVNDRKAPRARFEIGTSHIRVGSTALPIKKKCVPGIPCLQVNATYQELPITETILGWSAAMSPDIETWAYLQLSIRNPSKESVRVPIRLVVEPETADRKPMEWDVVVPPLSTRKVYTKAPYGIKASGFTKVSSQEWNAVWNDVKAFWLSRKATKTVIKVPDARIQAMAAMSLAYSFVNVDKVGSVYEPHDGSGFYEFIYGYSAVLYCDALDLWGYHKDSQRYLDSLLTLIQPDGLFEVNYGLSDMGGLLMAMSRHYRLTGDAAWLKRVSPQMIKVAEWLFRHRKESQKLVNGKRPVTYGLIKHRPYCDFATPTFAYISDCYCVIGLEEAAKAFAEVGLSDQSKRFATEAASYRADVLASMKAAVFKHDGIQMLPMEPETHRLLKDNGYTGGDYYGLVAPILLETEFLSPKSTYAKLIVDQLENRNGLILRMCRFNEGIDHAYTYGYWMDLLQRDQIRPLLVGFYGALAYGMSRDTFAPVECTQIKTGLNDFTTPHTYSITQQLRLLRMMLVREEGDTLWLGQAIPRDWMKDKKVVSVQNAPTLFGNVTYSIRSDVSHGQIVAKLTLPVNSELKRVKLRFRVPEGRRIISAKVDGRSVKVVRETVEIRPTKEPVVVVVHVK